MATTLLGTGVFILPQMTVAKAGSGALLAWALLTLAIIPVTWCLPVLPVVSLTPPGRLILSNEPLAVPWAAP